MNNYLNIGFIFLLIFPLSFTFDPDQGKSACELIESRNFICENHWVTTIDGYILGLQRIVHQKLTQSGKVHGYPIILQHGLFGWGNHFITNAPGGEAADWTGSHAPANLTLEGRNLGFLLSNKGYDVWLANSRGNFYSRNHTYLNPDRDSEFWRFSFDEMISYDSPAIIDYIIKTTGSEKVTWIGHSQGTLLMFGLLSEKPEYASKVDPFIALAPIAHVEHITSPMRLLCDVPGLFDFFFAVGGPLSLPQSLLKIMGSVGCSRVIERDICSDGLFLIVGWDAQQLNKTRDPVYISQGLGGSSAWDFLHFGQNILNKGFYKFDYGLPGNLIKYKSTTPPPYRLDHITSENIILITSDNDPLSDPRDVEILRRSLQVPFKEYNVPDPQFSHLDFIWAENVYDQVYSKLLSFLEEK